MSCDAPQEGLKCEQHFMRSSSYVSVEDIKKAIYLPLRYARFAIRFFAALSLIVAVN
jgi:hypothetical protein